MQDQKFEQLRVVRSAALVADTKAALGIWTADGRAFAFEIPGIAELEAIRRHLDSIEATWRIDTQPT